mmetsp:Transcript_11123/g.28693  ORF Transcript_11123/g.28693 Transcript_11123/m.28693 type:complete len:261 (+) Transcript_11123:180-962(+)
MPKDANKRNCSEPERQECRHTCLDPLVLDDVRVQLDVENEVRGVARRQERAFSGHDLVARAPVVCQGDLAIPHRAEPKRGQVGKELFWFRIVQLVQLRVPPATLQKNAVNVYAVHRRDGQLLLWIDDIVAHGVPVREQVDLFVEFPCIVLHGACEERLREEDTAHPEDRGCLAQVIPLLEELDASEYVQVPAAEGLQRQRPHFDPHLRLLVDEEGLPEALQLARHDDEALDGLAEVLQSRDHLPQQLVVAQALLLHHRVH